MKIFTICRSHPSNFFKRKKHYALKHEKCILAEAPLVGAQWEIDLEVDSECPAKSIAAGAKIARTASVKKYRLGCSQRMKRRLEVTQNQTDIL
jgi:hypothetical protein